MGELGGEDRVEGKEEGQGEEVRVEEVGTPVVAVLEVDVFDVGAHVSGEELRR